MQLKRIAELSLAELANRALRFHLHLDAIETEFFSQSPGFDSITPKDKPELLAGFRYCIQNVLGSVAQLGRKLQAAEEDSGLSVILGATQTAFIAINELHEFGLIHLPRPSEPIELQRFCRLISKHVIKAKAKPLAVYMTEKTSDGAFSRDPISPMKKQGFCGLRELVDDVCNSEFMQSNFPEEPGTESFHVSIPRVDATNPLHWPTMMHEVAHSLFPSPDDSGSGLYREFVNWIPRDLTQKVDLLNIKLESWLTEVWCDIFAALVMGPSFLFSQYAAFIANTPVHGSISAGHPPNAFRLRLVSNFLSHRYQIVKDLSLSEPIADAIAAVEYWDRRNNIDVGSNFTLRCLYDALRGFFQEHFFSGTGTESQNFNDKYQKIVAAVHAIESTTLIRMIGELESGLPISSKPNIVRTELVISDEPSSMQEILLAAWLFRFRKQGKGILDILIRNYNSSTGPSNPTKELLHKMERLNDSVLRSLQISEWLHLLKPAPLSSLDIQIGTVASIKQSKPAVLNDNEIATLLAYQEIRVIPMVDLEQQLGSTSLDIRLGTSFQVYLPACRRTTDSTLNLTDSYESRRIDLDYLEHVVLLPGQSMLGHSFEYIKLPDWTAAELEGRSSYARLGLEIHMTAGMIDPGFEGVVTFELFNCGPNPIRLFPGLRVAQLRFIATNAPSRPYSRRHAAKYSGLLQHNTSLYMADPDFKRIQGALSSSERF